MHRKVIKLPDYASPPAHAISLTRSASASVSFLHRVVQRDTVRVVLKYRPPLMAKARRASGSDLPLRSIEATTCVNIGHLRRRGCAMPEQQCTWGDRMTIQPAVCPIAAAGSVQRRVCACLSAVDHLGTWPLRRASYLISPWHGVPVTRARAHYDYSTIPSTPSACIRYMDSVGLHRPLGCGIIPYQRT